MHYSFEWDPVKAVENIRKHGISFEEAETVFDDEFLLTYPDVEHSYDEDPFLNIGSSKSGVILIDVHTERDGRIRIISCRRATPSERRTYAEGDDRD